MCERSIADCVLLNMGFVINARMCLFFLHREADEAEDKEDISKVCEDEGDEDPENRCVDEKMELKEL